MEWIPDYINGKKHPESVHYVHPLLESVCKKTYGVLVFQEQVMEAARVIAGYSLGGADILRRAMGKKKVDVMNAQRETFVKGAWEHNGIHEAKANEIFDILAKFAGYGFNKSHSDAYAIIIYQTAYLKANFPTQYMAAILSSELGNADKLAFFIENCRSSLGIDILGPDINESAGSFSPIGKDLSAKRQIRFGLAAIKGVGDVAAKYILEERESRGFFKSFADFVQRVDAKALNKRVVECLIKAGAFDKFGQDRRYLLDNVESLLKEASLVQVDRAKGQTTLFDQLDVGTNLEARMGALGTAGEENATKQVMPFFEKLNYERELLGFYLSGHPLDAWNGIETLFQTFTADEMPLVPNGESFRLCGIVEEVNKRISKKNNRPWLSFVISTRESRYDLQLFSDVFDSYNSYVREGALVGLEGQVRKSADRYQLNVLRVFDFAQQFPKLIKQCHWILYPTKIAEDFMRRLEKLIHEREGNVELKVSFFYDEAYALEGTMPNCCKTYLSFETLQALRLHPAVYGVELTPIDIAPFPGRDFKRLQ